MKKNWIYRILLYLILIYCFIGCFPEPSTLLVNQTTLQIQVIDYESSILELTLISSQSLGGDGIFYPLIHKSNLGSFPIEANKKTDLSFSNFDLYDSLNYLLEYKFFTLNHSSLIAKGYFRNCTDIPIKDINRPLCLRNSLDRINVSRDWFVESGGEPKTKSGEGTKTKTFFYLVNIGLYNESLRWLKEPRNLRIFNNPNFLVKNSNFSGGDYKVISYELDENLTTIVKSLELVVPENEVRTIYTLNPQNEIPMFFRIVKPSNNEILYEALVKDYPFGAIRTSTLFKANAFPIDWQWRTNVSTTILSKSLQTSSPYDLYLNFPHR